MQSSMAFTVNSLRLAPGLASRGHAGQFGKMLASGQVLKCKGFPTRSVRCEPPASPASWPEVLKVHDLLGGDQAHLGAKALQGFSHFPAAGGTRDTLEDNAADLPAPAGFEQLNKDQGTVITKPPTVAKR